MINEICANYIVGVHQTVHEAEYHKTLKGVQGFIKAGCFHCGGSKKNCPNYFGQDLSFKLTDDIVKRYVNIVKMNDDFFDAHIYKKIKIEGISGVKYDSKNINGIDRLLE